MFLKKCLMSDLNRICRVTFICLYAGLLLPGGASAQNRRQDVIFLKSGSVLTGNLIYCDSLRGVRIDNDCGSWLFSIGEVDSVNILGFCQRSSDKRNGYYNLSSGSLLFGEGADGFVPYLSMTMVNGYHWNQNFFTGAGLGYEYFGWSVLPVFAELLFFMKPDVLTPYLSLRSGYAFPLSKNPDSYQNGSQGRNYGGVLLNPEAGLKISVGERSAFLIGIGYRYQELSRTSPGYDRSGNYSRKTVTHYNRITLKAGVLFR
ncbi:hypothetical protein SDC9_24434 [bioreactor metagenome]|jgi:hypothetical protein